MPDEVAGPDEVITYYIVDTETSGLTRPEPPATGVVEVAAIQIDPLTLQVLSTGHARTNPGCPIEPGASAIHGIYDEDVVDQPPLGDVWGIPQPMAMGGHNHPFDFKYLSPYCPNIRGTFCTLALARRYLRGPVNYKLQTLADYYNLERGEAHNALGDCVTSLSLLKLVVQESGKSLPELIEASKAPKTVLVMPYGKYKGQTIHELPLPYVQWFLKQDIDQDLRHSFQQTIQLRG
jgi:DNA polymerase III epsilon subunit-like protein